MLGYLAVSHIFLTAHSMYRMMHVVSCHHIWTVKCVILIWPGEGLGLKSSWFPGTRIKRTTVNLVIKLTDTWCLSEGVVDCGLRGMLFTFKIKMWTGRLCNITALVLSVSDNQTNSAVIEERNLCVNGKNTSTVVDQPGVRAGLVYIT